MSARDSELFDAISHRNELILSLVVYLLDLLDDFRTSPTEPPSRVRVGAYVSLTRCGGETGYAANLMRKIEATSAAIFLRLGTSWDALATAADAKGPADTTRQALHRRLAYAVDRGMDEAIHKRTTRADSWAARD